jgi:ankyrin repeat protein
MKLYMDSLCDKTSKREIRDALKRLTRLDAKSRSNEHRQSAVLDAAYSDVVDRIKAQPRGHRDLALRVLMWITFAKTSLSLDTLRAAVCTIAGDRTFDVDNLRDIDTLISLCCGLVTLDEKSAAARLVHYTTQSYLEEYQSSWAPTAHRILTRDCVTHLMYDIPKPGGPLAESRLSHAHYLPPPNTSLRSNEMPTSNNLMRGLYDYSACFWAYHYEMAESEVDEMGELLRSDDHVHALMLNAIHRLEDCGRLSGILTNRTPSPDSDAGPSTTSLFRPLHLVAFFGFGEMVDEALQGLNGGPDVVATAPGMRASRTRSFTPMELAILSEHRSMVRRLVDEGASLNTEIYDFQPAPLLFAIQVGSLDMVGVLLHCGADVNRRRKFDGRTPVMIAASPKSEDTLHRLIEIGADVNLLDHAGFSALQIAVTSYSTPAARMLLEAGADINTRDSQQWTPLMWACVVGGPMVAFLLQSGADVHAVDDRKRSVLMHAVGLMKPEFVAWILEEGADIDAQDIYGETPLMKAAGWASRQTLEILLQRGRANVNLVDHKGQSALIKAAMAMRSEYLEDLIEAGADVNQRDELGETALMKICQVQDRSRERERQRSWKLLLENGAIIGNDGRHGEHCLLKDKCPVFERLSASVSDDISSLEIRS